MGIARGIERRLEKLADGASASLFRGRMHPIDMGTRLLRQLEFLAVQTQIGIEIPNELVVKLNRSDIDNSVDRGDLSNELGQLVTHAAADRGWRMVGPATIQVTTSAETPKGVLEVVGEHVTGKLPPWGQLIALDGSAVLVLSINQTLIGRSLDCDIRIANREASRHHVLVSRFDGSTMLQDLGSSNGTFVNGLRLETEPVPLGSGDVVKLGDFAFTYRSIN